MKNNWKDICVTREATLREAMQILDKSGLRVVFVINDENTLLGVVTDGDIRRGILRGVKISDPVSCVMNTHPLVANSIQSIDYIENLMIQNNLLAIPLVDQNNHITGIETIDALIVERKSPCPVVLMAGGLGKRLHPLTKNTPKPLLKVGSKPILESILSSFIEQGFFDFHISTYFKADLIFQYFGDGSKFGCKIQYVQEPEPRGTAGALSLLKNTINGPFIVMNADILTKVNFQNLLDFHNELQAISTMCVRENVYHVPYGVVEMEDLSITSILEKPSYSNFVSAGIYCFSSSVLNHIPLDTYLDMPTLFQQLIGRKEGINAFPIHEYWVDIGRMEDYKQALSDQII